MADTLNTTSSTAAAPAQGEASTPAAALHNDIKLPAPGTAVDLESMLAGGDQAESLGTGSGADDAAQTSEAGGVGAESGERRAESGDAAAPDAGSATTTQAKTTRNDDAPGGEQKGEESTGEDADEAAEAEDVRKAESKEVPAWVHPRLSKMAEQKRELRERLADAERQLQEKLDAEAEAAANPVTPLPSSAIAHLDTVERLDAEVIDASRFLEVLSKDPEKVNALYREVEGGPTVEEQVAHAKSYALHVIQHQQDHRKLLGDRKENLERVRKSVPAMFKTGTEEHAFYQKAVKNPDLRTDPEFHQLLADAWRGKQARLALEKAAQSKRSPVNSQKPDAGNAGASKEVVKVPPTPVPSVAATARAAVRTDDAPDARAQQWATAREQKPVSIDDMADSGALRAA